jgi:hypothetical protein
LAILVLFLAYSGVVPQDNSYAPDTLLIPGDI